MKITLKLAWYLIAFYLYGSEYIYPSEFITGKITDVNGSPIPFVEIYITGKDIGTTTDIEGRFLLRITGTDETILHISHSAYIPTDVTAHRGDRQDITIILQEKVYSFETVKVVGNLYAKESLNLPVTHQILNIQEFPSSGNSVGDRLDRMGIQMKDYGGAAGLKTAASPTGYGEHILVMVDGLPLNSLQFGTFDFSSLPADLFQQGEYYWGHGSSLYGSNAMGGVINLITDKNFTSYFQIKIGELGERGVNGKGSFTLRNIKYALYGIKYENDGSFLENNKFSQNSYGIQSNIPIGKTWSINSFSLSNNTERGITGSVQFPSPLAGKTNKDEFHIITLQGLSRYGQTEILLGITRTREHYTDPDLMTDSIHRIYSSQLRLVQRFSTKGRIHHNFIVDGSANRIKSGDTGNHRTEFESFGWLGQFLLRPDIQLTGTVRAELNRKSGKIIKTGSLGFISHPTLHTIESIIINIGTSYRNPTFNDLYWEDAYGSKGNPDLKPEKGISTDLAIKIFPTISNTFQLTVRGYHFYTKNLIQWSQNPDWTYSPVNLYRTESYGTSLTVNYEPQKVPVQFKFTTDQNESRNLSKGNNRGKRLYYVPAVSHWSEITVHLSSVQFHLNYRFYGKRRFTYSTYYDDEEMKPYDRYDFSISYTNLHLTGTTPIFILGVRNLQNSKNRQTVYGYPEPGRTVYARLKFVIP